MKQEKIDIIGASWLLSMSVAPNSGNPKDLILENGAVAVDGSRIIDVGDYDSLIEQFSADPRETSTRFYSEHILMPGLINNHGHLAMSLLRGYADDLSLQTWLQDHIWPAEAQWVDNAFVLDGALLAMSEMLLSGTTCASDMYFFPESTAKAAQLSGMRCNIFFPILEFPSAWGSGPDEYFDKGLALHDELKNSALINIGLGPHAPYTVSNDTFQRVAMYSDELDCPIQVHLHETAKEIEDSLAEHGARPFERLLQLGVIGNATQAVHVTQTTAQEIEQLASNGCSVIHCPSSNLKLASGFPAIESLLRHQVAVGIGTDSAASNNSLDLFEEIRISSLVCKHLAADAAVLDSYQALYNATLGGAIAAGLDNSIGSLEPGKQADLIAIDTNTVKMQPLHNPVSQLVHTAAGASVKQVWVNGKQLVENGQLTLIDQREILESAAQWRNNMHAN